MEVKNKILICVGTSGLSAGADEVVSNFKVELKKHNLLDEYQVVATGDKGLFVDVIVEIKDSNNATYINVKSKDVDKIVESHIVNKELYKKRLANKNYENFFKDQERIVLKNCGIIDPENINDYLKNDGYKGLEKTLKNSQEYIINEVTESGLRGRGGWWIFNRNKVGFWKKSRERYKIHRL